MRLVARLLGMVLWTLAAMPVQAVLLALPGRGKVRLAQTYWRGIAAILGLRIRVAGELTPQRPALFIANHCSWLDIIALGAVLPGCFVAKSAIAGWPLINWVARLGRTVFVSRSRGGVGRERAALADRLAAGDNLILFPEGTTSDGTRVMGFSSAFFSIADAPAAPRVQPVTLVYDGLDGLPLRRRDRPLVSWYGDMDLASHFFRLRTAGRLSASIILDPPIPPGMFANRKELAAALEARIAHNAAALRQGRVCADASAWSSKICLTRRGDA